MEKLFSISLHKKYAIEFFKTLEKYDMEFVRVMKFIIQYNAKNFKDMISDLIISNMKIIIKIEENFMN